MKKNSSQKTKAKRTDGENISKAAHLILPVKNYIAAIIIILLVMAFPPLMYCGVPMKAFFDIKAIEAVGFYITVAVICYTLIIRFLRNHYTVHLETFSEATKKVANGDLGVRLELENETCESSVISRMFSDFNKMVEELSSLESMKDDFIIITAHELKTPLAIIKSYTALLKDPELSAEEREKAIGVICETTDRLSGVIGNILQLNKIENRTIKPPTEEFDICRQLCDCILNFENIWEKKDIEVEVDVEESRTVFACRENLEIIWNNLLSNAFKFTDEGGTVRITESFSDGKITVSVIDSGCGMDEETKKHIFDKFYQSRTPQEKEGNGLGLALVKAVADESGYRLEVESEENRGSIFRVIIPVT